MTTAERNYTHIEKGALAIVFVIKKFHKYLYDRTFKVLADRQLQTAISDPKRATNSVAPSLPPIFTDG